MAPSSASKKNSAKQSKSTAAPKKPPPTLATPPRQGAPSSSNKGSLMRKCTFNFQNKHGGGGRSPSKVTAPTNLADIWAPRTKSTISIPVAQVVQGDGSTRVVGRKMLLEVHALVRCLGPKPWPPRATRVECSPAPAGGWRRADDIWATPSRDAACRLRARCTAARRVTTQPLPSSVRTWLSTRRS